MKTTIIALLAQLFIRRRLVGAANDADIITGIANDIGTTFDVQQPDQMFVPFGQYQHAKGLQLFDRESADKMIAAFNSMGSRIRRFFTAPGVPIYAGHPDVPGRPDSDPSAPALGWVTGIEVSAENDGITLACKWNEDGQSAIAKGNYRFYSPHWGMVQAKGGVRPVELWSVGLTNNPRIGVPSIANDETRTGAENDAATVLAALREKLGLQAECAAGEVAEHIYRLRDEAAMTRTVFEMLGLAADATPEAATEALAKLKADAGKMESAANDLLTAKTLLEEAAPDIEAAPKLREQLAAANDALAVEKAARVTAIGDALIAQNKCTPATFEARKADLIAAANDEAFTGILADITKPALPVQTKPQTAELGTENTKRATLESGVNDAVRGQMRSAIADEVEALKSQFPKMNPGARYDEAFTRAKKKHAHLFANA